MGSKYQAGCLSSVSVGYIKALVNLGSNWEWQKKKDQLIHKIQIDLHTKQKDFLQGYINSLLIVLSQWREVCDSKSDLFHKAVIFVILSATLHLTLATVLKAKEGKIFQMAWLDI